MPHTLQPKQKRSKSPKNTKKWHTLLRMSFFLLSGLRCRQITAALSVLCVRTLLSRIASRLCYTSTNADGLPDTDKCGVERAVYLRWFSFALYFVFIGDTNEAAP